MSKTVTVYGRNGEAELHTKPNARDLVANCNGYWSWNPQRNATGPMATPPFTTLKPPSNKPPTQEILERMGTGAIRDVEEVRPIEEPDDTGEEAGVVTVEDTGPAAGDEAAVPDVIATPEPVVASVEKSRGARRKRFEG